MNPCDSKEGERGGIITNLIVLLFFVIFCAVLYLARHLILRFAAEFWIIEDPIDKADAIIVLSDDNFYLVRATRASEWFRVGTAPAAVASGSRLGRLAGSGGVVQN